MLKWIGPISGRWAQFARRRCGESDLFLSREAAGQNRDGLLGQFTIPRPVRASSLGAGSNRLRNLPPISTV